MKVDVCTVRTGSKNYDIHIGENLIDQAGGLLAPRLNRPFTVIITDRNVDQLHGARLEAALQSSGVRSEKIVLEPGEKSKSFASLAEVLEKLLGFGVERHDMLVAFGGGVIGDLTGFAASILRRGCLYAQVPTTLLAQVDSSVGGKTAVNANHGKNLIGAFYQPEIVIADVAALNTLPARQLRAGYAEVVKYGVLGDEPFFAWLEQRGADVLGGDLAARRIAVRRSCETKADYVGADERETGVRAFLNLGHTFGHALEGASGYSQAVLHGEAVAVGMCMALDFSVSRGLCPRADYDRLRRHLMSVGLPTTLQSLPAVADAAADDLLQQMLQDKKVEKGEITLILVRRLGEAFIEKRVDIDLIRQFLRSSGAK